MYEYDKYSVLLQGRGVFDQANGRGENRFANNNYWVWNASLNYKLQKNTRLYVKVNNIFNQFYSNWDNESGGFLGFDEWYAEPGRCLLYTSGAYKIARPFNICTKDGLSEVAQDFVAFIMSKEGQEVVAKAGCIGDDKAAPYKGTKPAGKVVVAGSSSITPAMEKLKEAYMKINPAANIEIQSSDSTTGVKSAVSGICDIGMASRDLKKSELEQGLSLIHI